MTMSDGSLYGSRADLHRLRVYRFAERDRRPGDIGTAAVPSGPVQQYTVPVLRLPAGPDQGIVLGGGRIRAGDKAAGSGKLPVAPKQRGGAAVELPAVPLANGRAANRPAESTPEGSGAEHGLAPGFPWIITEKPLKTLDF